MARVKEIVVPVTVNITVAVDGEIQSNFDDVGDFHEKFGLASVTQNGPNPSMLPDDLYEFRFRFMYEELYEFRDARHADDLAGMADALVDLVYVALGTAHMMGLPWQELWDEVQRANMTKVRAPDAESSKRHHSFDVIKPEGFIPPNIEEVLSRWQAETG